MLNLFSLVLDNIVKMKKIIKLIKQQADTELLKIYHGIAYKRFILNVLSLALFIIGLSIYNANPDDFTFIIISSIISLIIMIITLHSYSIGSRKIIGKYFKEKFSTDSEKRDVNKKLGYYISKAEKQLNGKDSSFAFESFIDCLGIVIFVMNYVINLIVFLVVEAMLLMVWIFAILIGFFISLIASNFGHIIMDKASGFGKIVVFGVGRLYFQAFTTNKENVFENIKSDIKEYNYNQNPETMSSQSAEPYLANYISLGHIALPHYVKWRKQPELTVIGSNITVKGELSLDHEIISESSHYGIIENVQSQIERNLNEGIDRYANKYKNAKKVTIDIQIDLY